MLSTLVCNLPTISASCAATGRATRSPRKTGAEKSRDMTIYGECGADGPTRPRGACPVPIDTFPWLPSSHSLPPIFLSSTISTRLPIIHLSWLVPNPSSPRNRLISSANRLRYAMCAFFPPLPPDRRYQLTVLGCPRLLLLLLYLANLEILLYALMSVEWSTMSKTRV